MPLESFFLQGRAGRIECLLKTPGAGAGVSGAAVVCHPHPLYGGTMHSKVVYAVASALVARGLAVLRFNFRSVGLSAGAHDGGAGEQDDLARGIDHLAAAYPDHPLMVAGYSFGAWVGLQVGCRDARVGSLLGIGVPVSLYDFSFLHTCTRPVVLIQGDRDRFGTVEEVDAMARAIPGGGAVIPVHGAGHDFAGHLDAIRRHVGEALPRSAA